MVTEISTAASAWCRYSFIGSTCVFTPTRTHNTHTQHAHTYTYTQNAFRCFRQSDSYWYLEEEHRRTINLGDRRLRGWLGSARGGWIGEGVGKGGGEEGGCLRRVQVASAFKVAALARHSAAKSRDAWFLLFPSYPFLPLRIDDVSIFRQTTSDSWLSLGSGTLSTLLFAHLAPLALSPYSFHYLARGSRI